MPSTQWPILTPPAMIEEGGARVAAMMLTTLHRLSADHPQDRRVEVRPPSFAGLGAPGCRRVRGLIPFAVPTWTMVASQMPDVQVYVHSRADDLRAALHDLPWEPLPAASSGPTARPYSADALAQFEAVSRASEAPAAGLHTHSQGDQSASRVTDGGDCERLGLRSRAAVGRRYCWRTTPTWRTNWRRQC